MKAFEIYVNGEAYRGEGESTYDVDQGALGVTHSQGGLSDLLIGGGAPERVVGVLNLTSAIQRILRRMRDRRLDVRRIEIVAVGE